MRFLFLSAAKDLRRRLTDPFALLLWLGIPLMIGGLMGLASGGGSGHTPKAHVLLVDEDNSFISNLLAGSGGGQLGEFLEIEKVGAEEGRRRINAGEASAMLVLPEGFAAAVLEEQPATLTLITNPAQRILPGMVEEALEILVDGSFYAHRLLGEPLRQIAAGPPEGSDFFSDATIADISTAINQRVTRLDHTLFPPVLELDMAVETRDSGQTFNFGIFFLPGVLFMSLLFIAQGMSDDIWREKNQGTIRRVVSAPQHVASFLGGKLAAGACMMCGVALAGLLLGALLYDLAPARLPLAILWCTFAGTALYCYFLLAQFLVTSQRAGNILTSAIVFPLMMIGGSFFPLDLMPDWMARVGRWTPNGLGVVQLKAMLGGEAEAASLLLGAAGIGLPAAVAFVISLRRLRGRFDAG